MRLQIPKAAAKASAEACVRDPTATTCCVVEACRDATKREAIHPVPSTPQRRLGTDGGDGRRGAGRASGSERVDTAYLLGGRAPRRTPARSALVEHDLDGVVLGAVAVVAVLDRAADGVERGARHRQDRLGRREVQVLALGGRRLSGTDALATTGLPPRARTPTPCPISRRRTRRRPSSTRRRPRRFPTTSCSIACRAGFRRRRRWR